MKTGKPQFENMLTCIFFLWFLCLSAISATKYAGDFEGLGASARAIGIGGAYVSCVSDASAIYYNPAASTLLKSSQLMFLHSENFSQGIVQNNFLSYLYPQQNQTYGIAVLTNRIPDIKITKLPYPDLPPGDTNRPYLDRIVNASDWITYFNYAKTVSDNLSIGGNLKIIYRSIGVSSGFGMGIDLAGLYAIRPDFKIGLKFANLSTSPLFWSTKTVESIMPRLDIGLSKTIVLETSSFLLSASLNSNFDDLKINTNLGIEYLYKNALSFRVGLYNYNPCFGIGFAYRKIFIDYAYIAHYHDEELGNSQKFSGGIQF